MKNKINTKLCHLGLFLLYTMAWMYIAYRFAMQVAKNKDKKLEKNRKYLDLYSAWLKVDKDALEKYFKDRNVQSIAIYGKGNIGKYLYLQLQDTAVTVKYFIDRTSYPIKFANIEQFGPLADLPDVDMIVVTPCLEFDKIREQLNYHNKEKIVSIEDVIYGALKE